MPESLTLCRTQCLDSECVNVGLQQVSERIINHSMPLYATCRGETVGNDRYVEVPLAVLRSDVACVHMTLVFQQKFNRIKSLYEAGPDSTLPIHTHGNTGLKGLTITLR